MTIDSSVTLHDVKRIAPSFFGASRYKSEMTYEDPAVQALRRLAYQCGGVRAIADAIDANWQSLDQIVKGVKLPSGAPRGVGAQLRRKLSERYPGWLTQTWDATDSATSKVLSLPVTTHEQTDIVIPQFETGGAMGHGLVLREQPGIIKQWTVSESWLQQNVHRVTSPRNLAIVTGFGPSMQPVFNPGDPLLVDTGVKRADSDGVYFFRVGDEGFVKQIQRIPTESGLILRAKSYNTLYDPFDITSGMDFEVFGRVVKVWKGEEF